MGGPRERTFRMRILMFEDEGCNELAPRVFCEARGHIVVGVTGSPDEAMRLAHAARPEIALVLSLAQGSDDVFMLMHSLSRLGVASLLLSCEGAPAALRWDEDQLAAALSRYARKFRHDDGDA